MKDNPDAKILLTTFSQPLANALKVKLTILLGKDSSVVPRLTILPFESVARDLYTIAQGHRPKAASEAQVMSALKKAAEAQGLSGFSDRFLYSEWVNVIDAWQIESEDAYSDVPRLGRKNRLGGKQRSQLWPIFEQTRRTLEAAGTPSWSMIYKAVTDYYAGRTDKPFTHIVIDEAQDLGIPELRMFAAVSPEGGDSLFFSGDLGQRIFQEPFSWKALGIDIRGRSKTLKVNYRTSHQIRMAADKLLPGVVRDVDGEEQDRKGTVSVFNGPDPQVDLHDDEAAELAANAAWLKECLADGVQPHEIGIFVRSDDELSRARQVVRKLEMPATELSERVETVEGRITIGTMPFAKGLEFKCVVVMACDEDVLPLPIRMASASDNVELQEVYDTERQLFYVACTRARDKLKISGLSPGSDFLEDIFAL